ncbi:hypothetical protein P153DRAFT_361125 [Dothidotthia symphoricarpi CBS 119687]|uniref:Uncharacterized protein n=1 Tax=Dothidotthia symphoricarpi CBS 119687 TaxID=1392245 RepID=A0A6A5ZXZ2_9PLEO|nr:uncharacterized protein P153DRAFT_361125 [Dothidotthia symphoricarpi CBS 119687]KAF2124409.1 hypothetical protein P153DRAFT_361125 [Dothidotthia symphoricarpi CBS 119687]
MGRTLSKVIVIPKSFDMPFLHYIKNAFRHLGHHLGCTPQVETTTVDSAEPPVPERHVEGDNDPPRSTLMSGSGCFEHVDCENRPCRGHAPEKDLSTTFAAGMPVALHTTPGRHHRTAVLAAENSSQGSRLWASMYHSYGYPGFCQKSPQHRVRGSTHRWGLVTLNNGVKLRRAQTSGVL